MKSIGEYNVPTVKPSVDNAQATADNAISPDLFFIFPPPSYTELCRILKKPHAQRARTITPKTAAIIAAPFSSRIYVFSQAVRLLFMRLRTFLRNLSAPATKRKQAVHAKISIAAGNALRAGVAAHLFIFVVRGRAFVLVFAERFS